MNTERLTILADYLENNVKDTVFDLGVWRDDDKAFNECGYVACAVGHACNIPAFRELGLRLIDEAPAFAGMESWSAVEAFFNLTEKQAERLFTSDEYANPTRSEVIKRIRDSVARRFAARRS